MVGGSPTKPEREKEPKKWVGKGDFLTKFTSSRKEINILGKHEKYNDCYYVAADGSGLSESQVFERAENKDKNLFGRF